MFYSKTTGGFYETAIHGPRKINVIDPVFAWPQIEQEGEDGVTVLVNDPDITPPMVDTDNPDCKIPADAVEITDEEHAALIEGQASGKIITADENGYPILSDPPPPTTEQVIASYTAAVQQHLDDTAKQRGYDGILSACTYATSTNAKFSAEGQAAVAWRDAVWATCYATLAAVESGAAVMPTIDELMAVLPAIIWP